MRVNTLAEVGKRLVWHQRGPLRQHEGVRAAGFDGGNGKFFVAPAARPVACGANVHGPRGRHGLLRPVPESPVRRLDDLNLDDDIVKIGIWTASVHPSDNCYNKMLIAFLSLGVLTVKLWATVAIYMYFWNTPVNKKAKEKSRALVVLAQMVIYVLTATDIVDHTRGIAVSLGTCRTSKWSIVWTILSLVQVYQAILLAFDCIIMAEAQVNILDVLMNFAGLLVLRELDNYTGRMYLRWTSIKNEMLTLKLSKDMTEKLSKISLATWWCYFLAIGLLDQTLTIVVLQYKTNKGVLEDLIMFWKVYIYYTIVLMIIMCYLLTWLFYELAKCCNCSRRSGHSYNH